MSKRDSSDIEKIARNLLIKGAEYGRDKRWLAGGSDVKEAVSQLEAMMVKERIDEHDVIDEMKPLTTVNSLVNLWKDRMAERQASLKSKLTKETDDE